MKARVQDKGKVKWLSNAEALTNLCQTKQQSIQTFVSSPVSRPFPNICTCNDMHTQSASFKMKHISQAQKYNLRIQAFLRLSSTCINSAHHIQQKLFVCLTWFDIIYCLLNCFLHACIRLLLRMSLTRHHCYMHMVTIQCPLISSCFFKAIVITYLIM